MKTNHPHPSNEALKILRALKRAAKEARRQAKIHGTKVWVIKDGKVVGLEP